ncbi:toxin PIN [Cutibacterium acnes]
MTRWYLDISATAFDLQVNALAIYDQRLQSATRDCGLTVVAPS